MTLSAADLDRFRGWIGREAQSADVVSADLARKFRATFDAAADGTADPPQAGDIVPRLIHFCLAQPAVPTAQLGEDGHPQRGGFLPTVPLPRRMWAGGALTFQGDLRIGDAITRTSRIADVSVKEGRSGVLCFVTVQHTITVDGAVKVKERQDIVYRGADGGAPLKTPPACEPGEHRRAIDPSPPFLFRYSALTFNGHRIHYDRRYATSVEGYPGLVVHGPLQATLLMNFATAVRGTPPARFSFRSVSPLFDNDPVLLHARAEGEGLKLWTARPDGPEAMIADAAW